MHQFQWVSVLERIYAWVSGVNGKWWLKNMDTWLYFFYVVNLWAYTNVWHNGELISTVAS